MEQVFGNSEYEGAEAVAVDHEGNVVLTGSWASSLPGASARRLSPLIAARCLPGDLAN